MELAFNYFMYIGMAFVIGFITGYKLPLRYLAQFALLFAVALIWHWRDVCDGLSLAFNWQVIEHCYIQLASDQKPLRGPTLVVWFCVFYFVGAVSQRLIVRFLTWYSN